MKEDKEMNLNALKNSAEEITNNKIQIPQDDDDAELSIPVGSTWWQSESVRNSVKLTGNIINDSAANKGSISPLNVKPTLPEDGVNTSLAEIETKKNYSGPGLVINQQPEQEDEQEPQPVGYVSEETDNLAKKALDDLDLQIEVAKEFKEEVNQAASKETSKTTEDNTSEDDEDTDDLSEDSFNEKYEEAIVTIDKTGMGQVINFTDEEREKLEKAKKIKLEEIEIVEIKSFKSKKPKKGSLDKILKRQPSVHTTQIVLPASGYSATMIGCSTYELISLMTDTKNVLVDTETKWTLIYNKIESTSLGKMDFNQFLQNTAAIDYNVFIYGILCATYPDDDKIPLKCEADNCGKEFEHHYSIKSLIRAEKMSDKLKDLVVQIVDASHTEGLAKEFHDTSAVNKIKTIVLPVSNYVVEIYIQSAYDFLYKSIKELGNNKDQKFNQAAVLSSVIRTVHIPDPDNKDEYYGIDGALDITKILFTLCDTDILVITKMGDLLIEDMTFEFGLMDVNCPFCKHHSVSVPMDLETILFYKYQQAMNTKIE